MSLLKFLLTNQLKHQKPAWKTGGFTLIELLVAMVLAFLVITPLLGLAINIMDTDRKEQVKSNAEQEIKTAMDYIAQDLQQAVYIYDDEGLSRDTNSADRRLSGIKDQIPPIARAGVRGCDNITTCTPVLVFWKRQQKSRVMPPGGSGDCGILSQRDAELKCDDAYVYTLVGYYLIKGNSTSGNTWSNVARIARFEISDGVLNPNPRTNRNQPYITYNRSQSSPSKGFKAFKLGGIGTLKQKMNQWKKDTGNYDLDFGKTVLVDYIDLPDPDLSPQPPGGITCDTTNVNPARTPVIPREQRVPRSPTFNSFYACVSSSGLPPNKSNYARIYIRGNALARIQKTNPPPSYSANKSTFFPTVTMQVQGNGSLFTRQ
jgi:type II secretory pathway pseudopilin PulG